jgi:hypothetical protein
MSEKKFDKRFGMVAIEKGFITSGQLIEALNTQVVGELKGGNRRLIGQILQDKGYITNLQIDEVLIFMGLL